MGYYVSRNYINVRLHKEFGDFLPVRIWDLNGSETRSPKIQLVLRRPPHSQEKVLTISLQYSSG